MTTSFIELDVDEICSMFNLEDGNVIRKSDNRWNGIDVSDQKLVRIKDERVPLNRVKYVLLNGVVPVGEVLVNDIGDLVDVVDPALRQVLISVDKNHTTEYRDGKHFSRYTDKKGIRRGKAFSDATDAREYSKIMTRSIWSDDANRLGFTL